MSLGLSPQRDVAAWEGLERANQEIHHQIQWDSVVVFVLLKKKKTQQLVFLYATISRANGDSWLDLPTCARCSRLCWAIPRFP